VDYTYFLKAFVSVFHTSLLVMLIADSNPLLEIYVTHITPHRIILSTHRVK